MSAPKRKSRKAPRSVPSPDAILAQYSAEHLALKAEEVKYAGVGYHKKNVNSYPNLQPPANPRPFKTLCDAKRLLKYSEALRLLKSGIQNAYMLRGAYEWFSA